jgi:AcrR family transcriptional regulator
MHLSETMVRNRRKPGPHRSLTRERVVAAGLEVTAAQGLTNLSLRAVAQHLGVDHKTLYLYVSDKDDLLAGMFDHAMGDLDLPTEDDERPPAQQLVALFISVRRLLLANAELFQLTRPTHVIGPRDQTTASRVLAALTAVCADGARAAELYVALTQLAVGSAMESARSTEGAVDMAKRAAGATDDVRAAMLTFADGWTTLDRETLFTTMLQRLISYYTS